MTLDQAKTLADKIVAELTPFCDRIDIAGSIRRQRPIVNDIDLVVLITPGKEIAFRLRCLERAAPITDGQQNLILKLANGEQLDVFIADQPATDLFDPRPTNYGSLLLCRTGSREHNIWLCQIARQKDLRWNPQYGLYNQRGQLLAAETETEIFHALDLGYLDPTIREINLKEYATSR